MNEPCSVAAGRIVKRYRGKDASRLVHFLSDQQLREEGMGKIVRQVIDAIEKSPMSMYEISKRTGVSQSQLSRFVREERTITLDTLEKLCEELGIEVNVSRKKPAAKK